MGGAGSGGGPAEGTYAARAGGVDSVVIVCHVGNSVRGLGDGGHY